MMSPGVIFNQNPDVIIRHEGDKALAFHQGTGWICIMNPTSLFIWEHCNGEYTAKEIAQSFQEEFDLSESSYQPTELENIVEEHLDLLSKGKMLEPLA